MRDEPAIDRATLRDAIRSGWGRTVRSMAFLPVGLDAHAWAYEVVADDGERLFLKVRTGTFDPVASRLPRCLKRLGLREVVAPLEPLRPPRLEGLDLLLYPFIAGESRKRTGLSDRQWIAYGAFLGALHAVRLPAEVASILDEEAFGPAAPSAVRAIAEHPPTAYWKTHGDELRALADRVDALAVRAAAQQRPHVVCHGDAHLNNVLADGDGPLHIVDWDAPISAPRERDLVFAISGAFTVRPLTDRQRSSFLQGYGHHAVDPLLMAYYLYERAVDDIRELTEAVLRSDRSEESRRGDLETLRTQLDPGGLADRAQAWEAISGRAASPPDRTRRR